MTKKCVEWLNNNRNSSPRLVYDLEKVKENFSQFVKLFGVIKPYYAVKANPSVKIIALLNKLGSNFDCASINEIKICTDLGISAKKISFGNTVKKSDDIKKAFKLGVKLFAFDCEEELLKIREDLNLTKTVEFLPSMNIDQIKEEAKNFTFFIQRRKIFEGGKISIFLTEYPNC